MPAAIMLPGKPAQSIERLIDCGWRGDEGMRGFYAATLLPINAARYIFRDIAARQLKRIDAFLLGTSNIELAIRG